MTGSQLSEADGNRPPALPKDEPSRELNDGVMRSVQISKTEWSAPIPPPEAFNKYPESVQNRIMDLVEKESNSRHELLKNGFRAKISGDRLGQHYSFTVVMVSVMISAFLVLKGHPYGLIALVGIIPTMGAFLEKLKGIFHSKKDGES